MTDEAKANNNNAAAPAVDENADASKKLLMVVGDFCEDYEVMVPYQTLLCARYVVDVICPGKKAGESIKTSVHDFEGDQTYSEKRGHNFVLTRDFEGVMDEIASYKGLVIPGGRAPEYLSINAEVIALVSHFTENCVPIACICHGILVLAAVPDYLRGKSVTCYPACAPAVTVAGGTFLDPSPITSAFTTSTESTQLVTAAAWPAHPQWMQQFMAVLGAKTVNKNATKTKKSKVKVLMIAGDYVEDYEVQCPFQMLLAFGVDVDVVCPGKKAGDTVRTSIHDFEGDQTYSEKPGHNFALNATFDEVLNGGDLSAYDGLYIPGGRAPEYLSVNADVIKLVSYFVENNDTKPIASICHGQLLLAAVPKSITGKTVTAYPACKPVVCLAGGNWAEPEPITTAFTDGNLVTAAAWPAHPAIVRQFLKVLGIEITI